MLNKRSGFTLIELLVAITIFSGVMILSLGAFARSASSAFKVSATREKTEAARRIVDQISNDFQYIYTPQSNENDPDIGKFKDKCGGSSNTIIKGFCFLSSPNSIELLLRYPSENTYVRKIYQYTQVGIDGKITVSEERGCEFNMASGRTNKNEPLIGAGCTGNPTKRDTLDTGKYSLAEQLPIFDGVSIVDGTTGIPPLQKGYLKINLKVKPVGADCTSLPGDSCYQLKTTLTPGGI